MEELSKVFNSDNDRDDSEDNNRFDVKKEKNNKKKASPKKSLFFSNESLDINKAKPDKKEIISDEAQKAPLTGIVEKIEKTDTEKLDDEKNIENQNDLIEEFQELVDEKLQEVEQEIEENTGDEALASANFLNKVGENLEDGATPELAIEEALEESIDELEKDGNIIELGQDEVVDINNEITKVKPIAEIETKSIKDDKTVQHKTIPSNPTQISIPMKTGSGSINGSMIAGGVTPFQRNPNQANSVSITHNKDKDDDLARMNNLYYRRRNTGQVLVAGTIGYLFGRRRGRIKTEKKLIPEIEKRDTKIVNIEYKLNESEKKIRKVAAEKVVKSLVTKEVNTEITSKNENNFPNEIPAETIKQEKLEILQQEEKFAETLISNETPIIQNVEKTLGTKKFTTIEKNPDKFHDAKTMRMDILLEVAEMISHNSVSLRELYNSKKIDVVNLRRVVADYLAGGDYEKTLISSLDAVEMKLELKNEIKQEESLTLSTSDITPYYNQVDNNSSQSFSINYKKDSDDIDESSQSIKENHVIETIEIDDTFKVSNATSVILIIVSLIIIIGLVLLFNGNL